MLDIEFNVKIQVCPAPMYSQNEPSGLVVKNRYIKNYKFDITIFICFNINLKTLKNRFNVKFVISKIVISSSDF